MPKHGQSSSHGNEHHAHKDCGHHHHHQDREVVTTTTTIYMNVPPAKVYNQVLQTPYGSQIVAVAVPQPQQVVTVQQRKEVKSTSCDKCCDNNKSHHRSNHQCCHHSHQGHHSHHSHHSSHNKALK